MQIHAPTSPVTLVGTTPAALRNWVVGQVLIAEVIGASAQNSIRLRLAGHEVDARTTMSLPTGQKLSVRVAALSPSIVLRVEPGHAASAPAVVERALARSLPQQASLPQALTTLRTLQRLLVDGALPGQAAPRTAAGEVAARVKSLLESLPPSRALGDATRLSAAFERAAVPLEKKLLLASKPGSPTTAASARSDVRGQLAALAAALASDTRATQGTAPATAMTRALPATVNTGPALLATPGRAALAGPPVAAAATPPVAPPPASPPAHGTAGELLAPRLREMVDGVVARIYTQQLANTPNTATPGAPLVVELPVMHRERIDLWRFECTEDERAAATADDVPRCVVRLRLQLDEQCSVSAELRSVGGRLSVRLGSDHAALHDRFGSHLADLTARLRARGVDLNAITLGAVEVGQHPNRLSKQLINDCI